MTPPFEVADPFRSNLCRLRRLSALSQEQLAFRSSLHRTAISLMERGERIPRIDTLVKLAAAIEVTPNDLLRGIEWLPPREQADGQFWTRSPLEDRGGRADG